MLISLLTLDEVCEINLHAEQVYNNLKISKLNPRLPLAYDIDEAESKILNAEKGIFSDTLTFSTLYNVQAFAEKEKGFKVLIIDFWGISRCQKNSHTTFREILNSLEKVVVVLKNVTRQVVDILSIHQYVNGEKSAYDYIVINADADINIPTILGYDLFSRIFELKIDKHFKKTDFIYHYSSSVYLNRFMDIKELLDSEDLFLLFCLYKLAIKVIKNKVVGWSISEKESNYILFCQTLNGSFITSILSELLVLDITFIDHLGPINKIYNSLNSDIILKGKNYIVISDVVCLGTEVKIAKSLIEYSGGKYCGNIALINVKSSLDKDRIKSDVEFLYEISSNHNILDYKIKTALDFKEKQH